MVEPSKNKELNQKNDHERILNINFNQDQGFLLLHIKKWQNIF